MVVAAVTGNFGVAPMVAGNPLSDPKLQGSRYVGKTHAAGTKAGAHGEQLSGA